jgi:UTP-glucose-1-phosphate uridylyltransferase
MKVRKAIIPAAGLGTRFLPVTKRGKKKKNKKESLLVRNVN